MNWAKVESLLQAASIPFEESLTVQLEPLTGSKLGEQAKKVFPGAVLLVGIGGDIIYHRAFGSRSILPEHTPLSSNMVFDVASLTKVLVTTTLVMKAVESGEITLDRKLSRIFQTFGVHGKEGMTIRHLLTHMSGYPATAPYYKYIARADGAERSGVMTSRGAKELVYNEIFRSKLDNLPGKVTKYSDIGFILLGYALEVIYGTTLDKLAVREIFRPLKMASTGYIDLSLNKRLGVEPQFAQIVPTARCPWRGRILCAEVHDDNAWAMGGVAAHSGVFTTAEDIFIFTSEMINCWHGRGTLFDPNIVQTFWTIDGNDPKSSWALGWDTPSKEGSSAGRYFSEHAVGHLAFTGCSIWLDPVRELSVILLSNRIHPSVDNNLIRDFRPVLHNAVMETLGFN